MTSQGRRFPLRMLMAPLMALPILFSRQMVGLQSATSMFSTPLVNEAHRIPVDAIKSPPSLANERGVPSISTTGSNAATPADQDCPFRDSPIYRKVYVYPDFGSAAWNGQILSNAGKSGSVREWPWLNFDRIARVNETVYYDVKGGAYAQYATEMLLKLILTHPNSCLRTDNPEEATLFYVPYMPTMERFEGGQALFGNNAKSPYGKAIMDILDDGNYTAWEDMFGLTSKYWRRRNGSDHILAFGECLHGLWHPSSRRGSFHYIRTQKQLSPPIVVSVELSTTFVEMYPKCAAKNILMPYPNADGRWFNGKLHVEAQTLLKQWNLTVSNSGAAAAAGEQAIALQNPTSTKDLSSAQRPFAMAYNAGTHGACQNLRRAIWRDYKQCSPSQKMLVTTELGNYWHATQVSTFCPCPGGDSPSAKRHFDAILAGCIPVILSADFVWPFTTEHDPSSYDLKGSDFSIRLNASDFDQIRLDHKSCKSLNDSEPTLEGYLNDAIPATEILRLRTGMQKYVRSLYSYYEFRKDLPDNPLLDGELPTGGAAMALVAALADRASGRRWPDCEKEVVRREEAKTEDPKHFKC